MVLGNRQTPVPVPPPVKEQAETPPEEKPAPAPEKPAEAKPAQAPDKKAVKKAPSSRKRTTVKETQPTHCVARWVAQGQGHYDWVVESIEVPGVAHIKRTIPASGAAVE